MINVNKSGVLIYSTLLIFIILMVPLYGDPAIVVWTSKIMSITGFAYDPVCTKNMNVLCVRSPLYYMLLATTGIFYKIIPIILFIIFLTLQYIFARLNGSNLKIFGLMFPPIYLLFSRTYVDSLTTALMSAFLITLINLLNKNKVLNRILLFLIPLLITVTRESSVILPLFLIILLMISPDLKQKLLIGFLGWAIGLACWQLYVYLSGGVSYSDFQPHIPMASEMYRALMTAITPILPWEIQPQDISAYINIARIDVLHPLIVLCVHLLAFSVITPIFFSLVHLKHVNKVVVGQIFFGLTVTTGLLFLKGDIDFFRHLAFLIPSIPLLIETGLGEIQKRSKLISNLIKLTYILLFALYFARTIRLYVTGYFFDPCQYLVKRPEISTIPYFYETACT